MTSSSSRGFDLAAMKQPVFDLLTKLDRQLQDQQTAIDARRGDISDKRKGMQLRREELVTLRADLELQHAELVKASYGILGCCYNPPNRRAIEIEARKERRNAIANYAKEAFEDADDNDDRELTLEELRVIEGDNAEQVMQEADVDNSGTLSKKEYVNYKIFVSKQAGKMARKAFKGLDLDDGQDLDLEALREIEGDNAEKVMREADVDGGGTLSKREYVDYKIRQAAHSGTF